MRSHRRIPHWLPLGAAAVLTLGAGGNGTYFPLGQGSRWHSVAEGHSVSRDLSGVVSELHSHDDYVRTIDGTEERFGRTYTILREELTETIDGVPDESTSWIRYRQDGTGLYEADVASNTPPGVEPPAAARVTPGHSALSDRLVRGLPEKNRAAYRATWERIHARVAMIRDAVRGLGSTRKLDTASAPPASTPRTAAENELTRLLYPLHKGQTWQIRPDPLFTSEVEATESLSIPAGRFSSSRIRVDSPPFFGPNDRVHLWMSRSGQLALQYHFEGDVTDVNGNVIGTNTFDYREELQDFDLAAR